MQILGREDYRVDPNTDDLFVRLIYLCDAAKEHGDPIAKTLKIIANATSYGILIEGQSRRRAQVRTARRLRSRW